MIPSWDAAAILDPQATALDEGRGFPLCSPVRLGGLFTARGFKAVDVRAIDTRSRCVSFQAYWSPFLSGQGPAPACVASLSGNQQSDLRERVRASLPIA